MKQSLIAKFAFWCFLGILFNNCVNEPVNNKDSITRAASTHTFTNDNFPVSNNPTFLNGFVAGEASSVRYGPVSWDCTLKSISFLFGGGGSTQNMTIKVYRDNGTITPDTLIFNKNYTLTVANNTIQNIDLSMENIVIAKGDSFRTVFVYNHSGFPSIALDNDGTITASSNLIFVTSTWYLSQTLGITSDWIIRAYVEEIL